MKNNSRPSGLRSYDARSNPHLKVLGLSGWKAPVNIGKDRSFVYDLNIERGIVRMRVVFVPRSVEIKPLFSDLIFPALVNF